MTRAHPKTASSKPAVVEGHGGSLDDIERFLTSGHRYLQDSIGGCQDFGLDALDFASQDNGYRFGRFEGWQLDAISGLLERTYLVTRFMQAFDDFENVGSMPPAHH